MVFKFAVLDGGDLLGFLNLEIPYRHRGIKSFKMDEWYPIKKHETESTELKKMQKFVARVIINYSATKKIYIYDQHEQKILQKEGFQKIAGNLKSKMKKIHQDLDKF